MTQWSDDERGPDARLAVRLVGAERRGDGFAADVRQGLTASPKFLPPKYLYDDLGARLFAAICALPEYYLTRVEAEILSGWGGEILAALPGRLRVLELGSGDAEKTPLLLGRLLARQQDVHYIVVDVAESSVRKSAESLMADNPGLRMTAFVGEYEPGLQAVAEMDRREAAADGNTLVLFLGTSLGNLEPPEQRSLLRAVRALLRPGDGLLLGLDMEKPAEILLQAYDDPLGVTAAFNRNLLGRINRELGGDFDLRAFSHQARYDHVASRIEMHLVSRGRQRVPIRALDITVGFDAGESIHTESSYRYSVESLTALARDAGFAPPAAWFDSERRFGTFLLVPAGDGPPVDALR